MIDTLYLANKLQEVLCQNSYGIDFLIFSDVGDLVTKKRKGTEIESYVQGVLEQTSSDLVPIKNIELKVINTELCLFVDINDLAFFETKGKEQSKNLQVVKEILNETLYAINGQTIEMSEGGKTYNVTIAMSEATNGAKTSLGDINELLPLYISISFTIFENGVNNNDIKIFINGEEIYFTRLVMSQVKTADQSTFANNKQSKVYMLMGGKSIDLTMPVLNTEFSKTLWEDICGGELNKPISFVMQSPLGNCVFIGVLGNATVTGDIGQNLGYNFSVVEGVEDLLEYYYQEWEQRKYTGQSYTLYIDSNKRRVIHWGDNDFTITNAMGEYKHNYKTSGNYNIKIYKG